MRSVFKQLSQALALFAIVVEPAQSLTLLPKPPGHYEVGHGTQRLVDSSRTDPFAPTRQPREVMCSIYYPVDPGNSCEPKQTVEYLPPLTAGFESKAFEPFGLPNGSLQQLGMQYCRTKAPLTKPDRSRHSPVVLFSPGLGTSRLLYGVLAQWVASSGYIVVSIDHPYDADFVEFPDGTSVVGLSTVAGQVDLALTVRAQDASFVLDQLAMGSVVTQFLNSTSSGLDVSKVAMFGHSLGGATSAEAMLNDSRIIGGANLDGAFYGSVVNKGLDRPFLLFGNQNHTRCTDPSWATLWSNLHAFKLELKLANSQHDTFTDLPIVIKTLGLLDKLSPAVPGLLGTIDGLKALTAVSAYVTAFLDFVLDGRQNRLLQEPSRKYPEVSFIPGVGNCSSSWSGMQRSQGRTGRK